MDGIVPGKNEKKHDAPYPLATRNGSTNAGWSVLPQRGAKGQPRRGTVTDSELPDIPGDTVVV